MFKKIKNVFDIRIVPPPAGISMKLQHWQSFSENKVESSVQSFIETTLTIIKIRFFVWILFYLVTFCYKNNLNIS